ncbi:MAG: O-antigen ligase family protein [Verrucomicrobiia bacterium]
MAERLDQYLEAGILGLTLGILIYAPVAIGAVLPMDFLLLEAMLVLIYFLWGLRVLIKPGARLLWTPVCWGILAFALYAAIRYLFADIEYVARNELLQIIFYTALFFAVLNNLHRRNSVWIILGTLLTVGTLISIYALYQYLARSGWVLIYPKPAQYAGRASGTYICPNHFAGLLAMLLPLGISLLLSARVGYIIRILLGYAVLMMVAGLVATASRAGWFAAGVGLFFVVVVLLHKRRFWLPVTVVLILLVFSGLYLYSRNYTAKRRVQENRLLVPDENRRILYWQGAIKIWKESPLFGAGGAHYDYRYRQVREPINVAQGRPGWAHNDYLNTLADYGLAGLAIIFVIIGTTIYTAIGSWNSVKRRIEAGKSSKKGAIVLGLSGGLIGIAIHSFFDFNMHIPANAIIAVTFVALLTAYWRYTTEECWIMLTRTGRAVALVCIVLVAAIITLSGARRYKEETFLKLANESLSEKETIQNLINAYKVEPNNSETSYNIGELLRLRSWEGNDDYKELAIQAMSWFRKAMDANPLDPYPFLRYGMCLDWIGRRAEAGVYFKRAIELDPNSYYMLANLGWHYFQIGDYIQAREMFTRSLKLNWWDNPLSTLYLKLIKERNLDKQK